MQKAYSHIFGSALLLYPLKSIQPKGKGGVLVSIKPITRLETIFTNEIQQIMFSSIGSLFSISSSRGSQSVFYYLDS